MPFIPAMASRLRFIPQHAAIQFIISTLSVIVGLGVLFSESSPSEPSSAILFWALTILPGMLIIYVIATLVIMPFPSVADLLRFITQHGAFRVFISILFAMVGVLLSDSSPFESNSIMFWTLTILPIIFIIYAITTLVIMPSFPFPSMADLLRFIAQHVAFGVFILRSFDFIGMCFPDSSLFEEIYVKSWVVVLYLFIYNANTMLEIMSYVQLTSIVDLLRFIPQHEGFSNLIEDLTYFVERRFPNSSPLMEITVRTLTFVTSRSIYRCTCDIILGSLACATLISFLISHNETPIFVYIVWATCVVSYLKYNRAGIPRN